MGGGGESAYNPGDIGMVDSNAGRTSNIPTSAYGPGYMPTNPSMMQKSGNWIMNNPDAIIKGLGMGASLVAPKLSPLFGLAGNMAEGAMAGKRGTEYVDAADAQDAVNKARKNGVPAGTPMPTMTDEQKAALARGAPRSQQQMTMEGLQQVRDMAAMQQEKQRQQQAQMAHLKPEIGHIMQSQGRSMFAPPGGQQKPGLAALAAQLVRRGQGIGTNSTGLQ